MAMSIEELRDLRIQLGISAEKVGEALVFSKTYVTCVEKHRYECNFDFLQNYEAFLTAVIDGKIKVTTSRGVGKCGGSFRKVKNAVSREKSALLQTIRKKLSLTSEIVARHVYMSSSTLRHKELYHNPTSQEEYDSLMKYYKQVKLQRIFGKNYKEAKHAD